VGVPTVTLFGPEHPLEWHPYPQDRHPRLFIEPLHCRVNQEPGSPPWCGLFDCIVEAHQCMTRISVDNVSDQIRRVYSDYGKDLRV
jgi:ADP-heptose:LPS heptosyltransferase